jgi:hypothetical protein
MTIAVLIDDSNAISDRVKLRPFVGGADTAFFDFLVMVSHLFYGPQVSTTSGGQLLCSKCLMLSIDSSSYQSTYEFRIEMVNL